MVESLFWIAICLNRESAPPIKDMVIVQYDSNIVQILLKFYLIRGDPPPIFVHLRNSICNYCLSTQGPKIGLAARKLGVLPYYSFIRGADSPIIGIFSRIPAILGRKKTLMFCQIFLSTYMYQKSEWSIFDQGSMDGKSEVKVPLRHTAFTLFTIS